ncbi:NAD(P)H-binding protein [Oleiphilus sp. HI0079]|uniref:NAD(P)H-binding protein n=1 Tax=Oleiphilus sp. HI0079 TaxID=1822254 RepID=UPI00083849F3|nr:NAD(P)H-binding protein [Oleiphilus sp. HI0079]
MENKQNTPKKIAWIAGATGLIGGHIVQQLCDDNQYDRVVAFVRRGKELSLKHEKLELFDCDWDQILEIAISGGSTFKAPTAHVDDLFCALGSTTKRTPDKTLYQRIDVEYPQAFAKLGKSRGARFFGLVSAHGANTKLPSFYLGMKKEVEQRIRDADYPNVAIARPSLLLGERSEFRLAESASEWFCKLLPGNYKAIEAYDVAAALIKAAANHEAGCHILESASMQKTYRHAE